MTTHREQCEKDYAEFTERIASHTVTVLRDDGLYRHLRCRAHGYAYSFDIITWPGYLAYVGDMGSFVFSRLPDMFEFFREKESPLVDRQYFAEKAVAADKHDGIRKFSEERFKVVVKEDFATFTDGWTDEERAELWSEVEDRVLVFLDEGYSSVMRAALDLTATHEGRTLPVFPELWDTSMEEYTPRFWWCCYAIPWAVARYDGLKDIESGKRRPDFPGAAVRAE